MSEVELPFVTLLRAIGRMRGEKLSLCNDAVTKHNPKGKFKPRVFTAAEAVDVLGRSKVLAGGNTWYGVARLRADFPTGKGRGWAKDVAGVRTLYADLDVKDGGLRSVEDAGKVIAEVSKTIGVEPAAVVMTGGGLQPYWRIERDARADFEPGSETWLAAVGSYRRFGRLVSSIAERHDGRVDSVFDLSRVLRVPGTINRKYGDGVMVSVEVAAGEPGAVSLDELDRILDTAGIAVLDEDTAVVGNVVSPREEWNWAPDGVVCQYARVMVESWADEQDLPRGRHPWLMGQATRLAAFHRAGLVTEKQYQEAAEALVRRFHELLKEWGTPRAAAPGEVALGFGWGQQQASSKTDAALLSEFGGHQHNLDAGPLDPGYACVRGIGEIGERSEPDGESWPVEREGHGSEEELERSDEADSETALGLGGNGNGVENDADLTKARQMHPSEMFADAVIAELVVRDVLDGKFVWVSGLGWMRWGGKRWIVCPDPDVVEAVRSWVRRMLSVIVVRKRRGPGDPYYDGWAKMLGKIKVNNVLAFCMGMVSRGAGELDANPDLLNTPDGIVDLRDGTVREPDPGEMMTKITSGSYRPGYKHPDWELALGAVAVDDGETLEWFQTRVGQGITGHRSPDGVNVVLQGGGQNGKGVLVSDGLVPALGDYAELASHKLILGSESEHSEEMASLQGKRFLVAEELTEGKALNVAAIKRISDVGTITARHVYQRNMTFRATHTLFATTNYIPVVNETDWGTWRRLVMLCLPYTYVESAKAQVKDTDRVGDSRLKARIEAGADGQHDAAVTWAVDGARRWYRRGAEALAPSAWVVAKTEAWRGSADRISSFWADVLWVETDKCILGDELFEAFNEWLAGNGHKPWGREMFESRFESHQVTLRHGVEKRRMRTPTGVSRHIRSDDWKPVALDSSKQHRVWLGVRFATSDDHRVLRSVPSLPKTK
jgi:P4 family phage/plasmid primase-like protien